MKALPHTPAFLNVARRVVWFKPPDEALGDPIHFLAHVMTYGAVEDLIAISCEIGKSEFREVLEHAPPGIFDPRSWAYWNLVCGIDPVIPMPSRLDRFMQQPPHRFALSDGAVEGL